MKDIIGGIAVIFAGSILLAASAVGLAGCAKQSNSQTNMQDQSMIELSEYNGENESRTIYINTHYIVEIYPFTYYDNDIEFYVSGGQRFTKQIPDKDNPHQGAIVYLDGEKRITVKETPEEILKLTSGY